MKRWTYSVARAARLLWPLFCQQIFHRVLHPDSLIHSLRAFCTNTHSNVLVNMEKRDSLCRISIIHLHTNTAVDGIHIQALVCLITARLWQVHNNFSFAAGTISLVSFMACIYNWHGNYLWFWSMQIGQFTNTNSVQLKHHEGMIIILCLCQTAFMRRIQMEENKVITQHWCWSLFPENTKRLFLGSKDPSQQNSVFAI